MQCILRLSLTRTISVDRFSRGRFIKQKAFLDTVNSHTTNQNCTVRNIPSPFQTIEKIDQAADIDLKEHLPFTLGARR
jgi:hypothetical protein